MWKRLKNVVTNKSNTQETNNQFPKSSRGSTVSKFGEPSEVSLSCPAKTKHFLKAHWRGTLVIVTPILASLLIRLLNSPPIQKSSLCALVLIVMAVFWVTEAMPLTVTSFIPMFAFPVLGVMDSLSTCQAYMTDTVVMFLASLFLAYSIELSGLHVRLALCAIRSIGYSHIKLLFAFSYITMFISMWINNTAATTMMVPINFAVLRVFEKEGMGNMYVYKGMGTSEADKIPSDIMVCYFCTATFSATIGGIGTLVGTGTNLAFKGLFETAFPRAPELLTFPLFSAFTIPYMLTLNTGNYFWMIIKYFGFLRPKSAAAKAAKMSEEGKIAAKRSINEQWDKLGKMTYYEYAVMVLFVGAILLFFTRQPRIFHEWSDVITDGLALPENKLDPPSKYIRDSAPAFFIVFIMFMLPTTCGIFKYCYSKYKKDLPNGPLSTLLDWYRLHNIMPWSFAFLLGAGFALSTAASRTGLSKVLGEKLSFLSVLPSSLVVLSLVIVTVAVTNFASNVAVANVVCPVAMELAKAVNINPLWLCLVSGLSASYCFMLPVGTPGNLVVQSVTGMPTSKMIVAGSVPSLLTILISWFFLTTYLKLIWDVDSVPEWAN